MNLDKQAKVDEMWSIIKEWITSEAVENIGYKKFKSYTSEFFWTPELIEESSKIESLTMEAQNLQDNSNSNDNDNNGSFMRMLRSVKRRKFKDHCQLDHRNINQYMDYFKSTFGSAPMGNFVEEVNFDEKINELVVENANLLSNVVNLNHDNENILLEEPSSIPSFNSTNIKQSDANHEISNLPDSNLYSSSSSPSDLGEVMLIDLPCPSSISTSTSKSNFNHINNHTLPYQVDASTHVNHEISNVPASHSPIRCSSCLSSSDLDEGSAFSKDSPTFVYPTEIPKVPNSLNTPLITSFNDISRPASRENSLLTVSCSSNNFFTNGFYFYDCTNDTKYCSCYGNSSLEVSSSKFLNSYLSYFSSQNVSVKESCTKNRPVSRMQKGLKASITKVLSQTTSSSGSTKQSFLKTSTSDVTSLKDHSLNVTFPNASPTPCDYGLYILLTGSSLSLYALIVS
ncbi:hypothetical protein ROZALSC1DRAFT_25216 [Rozella allomycis CSF55]|uniref:Uncharacterized protein n=1 Tax=Rozella allomycis (strain CSF55) TaxID=988480 RepID=A0A4P9YD05_ROZAC|nr:hypothetical protein ROZALSC1DRAFT_25216 [Rozella allomycis CSF55]